MLAHISLSKNVDVEYNAISGNAEFIVVGGHLEENQLRFDEDGSGGIVLTRLSVAS